MRSAIRSRLGRFAARPWRLAAHRSLAARLRLAVRLCVVALLGSAAMLLLACGGTGTGLIPTANAGPLRADFEKVAQAAQAGNGNCGPTEEALGKTEQDFLTLPASVDRGLRDRLHQGISSLRQTARAMCEQPGATVTAQTDTTSTPPSAKTTPATTPTQAPTVTNTAPPPPANQGGTPAEGEEGEGGAEADKGKGKGAGKEGAEASEPNSGGASAGGASPGGGR